MEWKDNGGSAFPSPGEIFLKDANGNVGRQSMWGLQGSSGMSLHAYFAGQALVGLLAHGEACFSRETARRAWDYADHMMHASRSPDAS